MIYPWEAWQQDWISWQKRERGRRRSNWQKYISQPDLNLFHNQCTRSGFCQKSLMAPVWIWLPTTVFIPFNSVNIFGVRYFHNSLGIASWGGSQEFKCFQLQCFKIPISLETFAKFDFRYYALMIIEKCSKLFTLSIISHCN